MELRWLESFLAVVDCGGFQQAATKLGLSQPAVSGHMKDLEASLGVVLIDRRRRPAKLTPAGAGFIRHARLVLSEVDAGVQHARSFGSAQTYDLVTLGTYPSATAGYVPHLLQLARTALPDARIMLDERAGGEMESAASSGRFDVFLRQAEPPLPRDRFGMERLWREDFLVVVPRHHAWAEDAELPIDSQMLLRTPLIMTGRFRPESLLGHPLWRGLGGYPDVVHRVQHPQSLLSLVESGAGVGLTTALPVAISRSYDVAIRRVDHPAAVREVFVNWVLTHPLTEHTRAVIELMVQNPVPPALRID